MGAYERPKSDSCPGDFDENGSVDIMDLLSLLAQFGSCSSCIEDMDGDGDVDITDLLSLLSLWGDCT